MPDRLLRSVSALVPIVLLGGCPSAPTTPVDPTPTPPPTGEGLFQAGCPEPGASSAFVIADASGVPEGTDVLAEAGDPVLMNSQAAFVIQAPGRVRTWWDYPGTPIDAVPVSGCAQAGPEQWGEMALAMGRLQLPDFESSVLRGFRGDSFEVLNDGADGQAAVVRVEGADDIFRVVELTLTREAAASGSPRPLSPPLGVRSYVDYVLEPDSPVLRIDLTMENEQPEPQELLGGAALFLGPHTQEEVAHFNEIALGGFRLVSSVPWLAAGSGETAYAFGYLGANLATTNISGVTALLDAQQILSPIELDAAGGDDDSVTLSFYLAVGAGALNSAVAPLAELLEQPVPLLDAEPFEVSGTVVELATGVPLEDAEIDVLVDDGEHRLVIDRLAVDEDGRFSGTLMDFDGRGVELVARAPGRVPGEPTVFDPVLTEAELALGPPGALTISVTEAGAPLPAKLELRLPDGSLALRHYLTPEEQTLPVPPGSYEWLVARGFEYSFERGTLTVPESGEALLEVELVHVVETDGWISADGHVHSQASPDSDVLRPMRLRTAAAHGLDIVISTDHEVVDDLSVALDSSGVGDWVGTVVGQEVTATIPEHTNAWPLTPLTDERRNGIPDWYGKDLSEIYALVRDRGATIRQMNHPEGYMELIEYDPVVGDALRGNPEDLALPPDAELWSFDFEAFEYDADPDRLEWWLSFLNHGHRITAVANSDVHGLEAPGSPRTWIAVPDDDPTTVDQADLVAGVLGGAVVASAGAFAELSAGSDGVWAGLGETLTVVDGQVEVDLTVRALPEIDIAVVYLLANCDVVATLDATDPDAVTKLDEVVPLTLEQDAHLVLIGYGNQNGPDGLRVGGPNRPRVTTNPVYLDVDGDGLWTAPGGKTCDLPARARLTAAPLPATEIPAWQPERPMECTHE